MNNERIVQFAVMCLQELEAHEGEALSSREISRRQGIPMPECSQVLQRLYDAGIVELTGPDRVVLKRSVEDLTVLDILDAVWGRRKNLPVFHMWLGGNRGPFAQKTLEYVRQVQASGLQPEVNG